MFENIFTHHKPSLLRPLRQKHRSLELDDPAQLRNPGPSDAHGVVVFNASGEAVSWYLMPRSLLLSDLLGDLFGTSEVLEVIGELSKWS